MRAVGIILAGGNKEDYPDGVLGSGETLIKAGEIA